MVHSVNIWVNAASQTALVQSFVAIAHTLHLSEQNASDASIVVDAVKHWLNTHDQWLLILDNADDESLIHATLPIEANGHILLTTRSQLLGDVVQNIEVKQMSTNDGVLLLLKRARLLPLTATYNELIDAPDRLAAEKLVETLGGLPLALDQAGAYVDQTRCGIAGYLEKYATHRDKLLKERGTKMTTYPESVATTWSLNFQEVETKDKAAIRLLRIYAYLYPDAIPEELEISPMKGTRLPKWLLQSFQLEGLTGDPIAFDQSIKILRAYSLVYRDTREQTLSVHRLVQVVLQDKLSKQWQKVYAENAIHFISHAFPDPRDVTTWSRCERYILHAQTCATWIEKWNLTSQENVTLLSNAGCYLLNRGQYKEAEPLLQLAVSILEQQPGKNKSNLASSLNNLGELYWRQGKYEQAEQLMQRSLLILQQHVGPHHILVAGLLNNLAEVYRTQSKYEQATELHQQALTIRKDLLEPDHPDIALSLNNLAGIFYETGKYKQSEKFVQEALSIRERQRGSHDPEVAVSLNDLAELYTVQGKKYEEAEALYKRALIIREEIYGYQHPEVANTLNNLAELYRAQGRYVEAGEFSEQALAIREEILGPDHLDVGVSLNNLAGLYEAQGRYKEAEKFYLRAITITQQSTTSDHPYLGTSLNNLAALYHAWEKYEQAEELYLRAITIAEQKFEKDHPHVIKSLQNYALLLKDMQRDAEAAALEKRIEKIIKPASD
jgi:tetratricopeptide (TPR) repeat protein